MNKRFTTFALIVAGFVALSCVKSKQKEEEPRIVLMEGISLPAISTLAWLDTKESPEGRAFISVSEDGGVCVWDVFSGITARYGSLSEMPEPDTVLSALNPDGTRELAPSGDGAVILLETVSGLELARYYCFADEWLCIAPEGYYNASFWGSAFFEVKTLSAHYRLDQLSGALFRPDLFAALLRGEKADVPYTLQTLIREENAPPQISLSFEDGELVIKLTEQKGGSGLVALYRRSEEFEIPVGFFRVDEAAHKKTIEKGGISYEIRVAPGPRLNGTAELGVSAFNENNSIESERVWANVSGPFPPVLASREETGPVLRVLFAAGDTLEDRGYLEDFGELFSLQEEGDLYAAVELANFFDRQRSSTNSAYNANDAAVFYLRGGFRVNSSGDFCLVTKAAEPDMPERETAWEDILGEYLKLPFNSLLIFDSEPDEPVVKIATALRRFRQRVGPGAMLAAFGRQGRLTDIIVESLGPGAPDRFMGAAAFLAMAGQSLANEGIDFFTSLPQEDFPLADTLINTGEFRFQTMSSGMLKIDRVDQNPLPLGYGETMTRRLPPGTYIIDMIYRNGYRETKVAELRRKDSAWVVFSYLVPENRPSVGAFPRSLPALGINLSELNPVNYERINREAMEGMGMEPWYVAYLAGEKFYREGDFGRAIAEYNRAISLRADYANAYVSRGNAARRMGNLDRAIEDYSRAINLESGYAEAFNYRGFAYAQKGDLGRAINDYTQAIRYRSNYADAYFNRAHAYGRQGNWERAVADYTQVLRLEPSNAVAYSERGNAAYNMGDRAKAAEDYAAAERLKGKP
jgi:tetratricopeptide (TPR) repeat protein